MTRPGPKPIAGTARSRAVRVRLTPAEYRDVMAAVRDAPGQTPSGWLREHGVEAARRLRRA